MGKRKRHVIISWVMLFVVCVGVSCVPVQAQEADNTVKVGYVQQAQTISRNNNGAMSGYSVDYLEEIAKHTDFSYEYIELTEAEHFGKLLDGTVDLLCNIPIHKGLQYNLVYSDHPSCTEYSVLYAAESNKAIFFEEYGALDGKRVGVNRNGSVDESLLNEYAASNGICFEKVYYDSSQEIDAALKNGEIDLVYASSLRKVDSLKLVAKVGMTELYYATSPENKELMVRLNEAQKAIMQNQPVFESMLYIQYFGKPSEVFNGITRLEYNFAVTTQPIKIACNANNYPIEYFDDDTGEYKGVDAAALFLVQEQSGLPFEYVKVNSEKEAYELLEKGEIDMVSGFYENYLSTHHHNIVATEPYLTINYSMLAAKDYTGTEVIDSVVIPEDSLAIQYYIQETHPEWQLLYANDMEECLEAVVKGEADITLINSIRLQTSYTTDDLQRVKILTTETIGLESSYAIRKDITPVLESIINKSIHMTPQSYFEACITENAVNAAYAVNALDVIKELGPYMVALIVIIFFAFFFVIQQREKHYRMLATEDSVSGLWTGMKFRQEATSLINRNKQTTYYLVSLDIDKFKNMNNNLGSKQADKILAIVGYRLRTVFADKALYARDMADMFLLMLEKCDNLEELLEPLSKEIYLSQNGKKHYYSLPVKSGVTIIEPRKGNEVIEKYVNQAISARKSIKGKVGVDIAYYDEKMKQENLREEEIEKTMNYALENHEFVVYYQPKYDLATETITGAEALVRWRKEDGTIVPPNHFIPLFEKNGFIINLDFYVFETVIRNLSEWIRTNRNVVPISVNVSRLHIGMRDFLSRLLELTEKYHVPTSLIELELTESVMNDDSDNIITFLSKCRDAGFKLSIDDFGSGYSSLNLLKGLPVDVLKIDREFLNETGDSVRSSIIVEQVIQMAKRIEIDTICEGVETREQADFLKRVGCHMVQGFLFSRPLPYDDFDKLI